MLNPIGVNVVTVDIPDGARPLLEASHRRALTRAEHSALIAAFNLSQGIFWSRPGSQGASLR